MDIINAIGRRKTAVARVYLKEGNGNFTINNRDYKDYFSTNTLQYIAEQPMKLTETTGKFDVQANITGGGITGQAEAFRHAVSRALLEVDENFRSILKKEGLLRRDPRMVERKKPGQKKARKRFQFSKR